MVHNPNNATAAGSDNSDIDVIAGIRNPLAYDYVPRSIPKKVHKNHNKPAAP